jgi:hypothetical protein
MRYEENGVLYPSVTQILSVVNKPYLVAWANKLGLQGIDSRNVAVEATRVGTLTHALIQGFLTGEEVSTQGYTDAQKTAANTAFAGFRSWHAKHDVKLMFSELPIISAEFGYGGTIDALLEVDGSLALVDFKTSKAISRDYMVQLSAYRTLLRAVRKMDPAKSIILRCDKDVIGYSTAELAEKDFDFYFRYFLAAKELYKLIKTADSMVVETRI